MWKKETEEDRKIREAEVFKKWEKQREIGNAETRKRYERYHSDSEYRKQEDAKTEMQNKVIYAVLIIILIASFFSTCVKPLFTGDKDPNKTEYEMNRRLRLN